MNIKKTTTICIYVLIIILVSTCFHTNVFTLADETNQTGTVNESKMGQGLNAQGNNSNRGFMQGYSTWIVVIVIIIVIVVISYVLITRNMKKQMEKNTKIMQEMLDSQQSNTSQQHINQENILENAPEKTYQKILLKFLNYNENRVMKKLLEHHGTVNQAEISRMPNMGKVKASRVLRDMKNKEIIVVETHGKINKIHLSDDLKSIFLIDKR